MQLTVARNGIRVWIEETNFRALLSPQQIRLLAALRDQGALADPAGSVFGLPKLKGSEERAAGWPRDSIRHSIERLAKHSLVRKGNKVRITKEGEHLTTWILNEIASYPPPARPPWANDLLK